ncbi:MAG: hypothetical protein ABSH52_31970 [Terriglobia bacterium]|jgi:MFS family permease
MRAFAREALEFAIGLIPIILGAILGMIGSVHCFRKIRRKGHRLLIAILVMIAGFLFGPVIAGLVVYSLFRQSAFNSENPSVRLSVYFFSPPPFSALC